MDRRTRRRLAEQAIDQLEPALELAEKATGDLSTFLRETVKLRVRLESRLRPLGYPVDRLNRVAHDLAEFDESCRKFDSIIREILKTPADPGLMSLTLGSAIVRFADWQKRFDKMSASLLRFRRFLSAKAVTADVHGKESRKTEKEARRLRNAVGAVKSGGGRARRTGEAFRRIVRRRS